MRVSHSAFHQVALSGLHHRAQPAELVWILRGHADDSIEGIGTVISRTRSNDQIHLHDVQFTCTQEVPKGEVQARTLVIDTIDQLQRADRACAVETTRVDHFEPQARRCHIHAFQRSQPFIEVPAGCLFDGNEIHTLHRQRRLFLFFADPASDHFCFLQQDLVGAQLELQLLVQALDLNLLWRITDEADHQGVGRKLVREDLEPAVEVRNGTRGGAFDHHAGTDQRFAACIVRYGAAQFVLLGACRTPQEAAKQCREGAYEVRGPCQGHRVGSGLAGRWGMGSAKYR